jgi:excisionase family DNA binding protein
MQAGSTQVQRRLLRGSEVALMLGVALPRVRRLVREGKLEAVRMGNRGWHRFRVEDVERLIAGERDAP